jgi:hypothetical protein
MGPPHLPLGGPDGFDGLNRGSLGVGNRRLWRGVGPDAGQHPTNRHLVVLDGDEFVHDTGFEDLDVDGRLVGVDHGYHVPPGDPVPDGDPPLDERAAIHVGTE